MPPPPDLRSCFSVGSFSRGRPATCARQAHAAALAVRSCCALPGTASALASTSTWRRSFSRSSGGPPRSPCFARISARLLAPAVARNDGTGGPCSDAPQEVGSLDVDPPLRDQAGRNEQLDRH